MRFFWSVVFFSGLMLIGFDTYESRRAQRLAQQDNLVIHQQPPAVAEDGTGFPPR
jgi:hypothetical protein